MKLVNNSQTSNHGFISVKSLSARFWEKVDRKTIDDCWNWIGAINSSGYGSININGNIVSSSRASWILHFGNIPANMYVLHRCDNRKCVNPSHLFLGSHADNMRDMANKGRGKTKIQHGENNPRSKLTENDVIAIRNLYAEGRYTLKDIGAIFDIKFQTVSDIIRKKRWKYL